MKWTTPLNAIYQALPLIASQALITRGNGSNRTKAVQVKEWLKQRCKDLYHGSVYCAACDYEAGTNPECRRCVEAMGSGRLSMAVPAAAPLAR